jgi:hypothetical protein
MPWLSSWRRRSGRRKRTGEVYFPSIGNLLYAQPTFGRYCVWNCSATEQASLGLQQKAPLWTCSSPRAAQLKRSSSSSTAHWRAQDCQADSTARWPSSWHGRSRRKQLTGYSKRSCYLQALSTVLCCHVGVFRDHAPCAPVQKYVADNLRDQRRRLLLMQIAALERAVLPGDIYNALAEFIGWQEQRTAADRCVHSYSALHAFRRLQTIDCLLCCAAQEARRRGDRSG